MSRPVLLALLMCAMASSVQAHIASNGFLVAQISGSQITGSLELAVRDAELAVGIDANGDGQVTWGELQSGQLRLQRYVERHLQLNAQSQTCHTEFRELQINDRVDGHYVWLPFVARCPLAVRRLSISYSLLSEVDPSHRGLLTLTAGEIVQTGVLGGANSAAGFSIGAPARLRAFVEYLQAGVWHIWSGIDHLLFLISLLLPAVLLRQSAAWQPVPGARPALVSILKVVTAFTFAHSITLSLAALDIVRLPSRLTESVIAASIIVAALNNIFPLVTEGRARIAFAFGLLHGFGFASVLADMGLPHGAKMISLLAFNLGIEAGQLAVVAAIMPLAYALRSTAVYRRTLLPWGSAAIASLALVWLVQRALLAVH